MTKVYVCTPLKLSKFPFEQIQRTLLSRGVFAFVPLPQPLLPIGLVIQLNKHHLVNCDEVWVFGRIGRDCAWEIGFAQALGKPIRFFRSAKNLQILENDEMMKSCPMTVE